MLRQAKRPSAACYKPRQTAFQLRSQSSESGTPLKRTPLHDLHLELGGKMVDFAGFELPVRYSEGIMASHLHCREKASLFDVSHMGQVLVHGEDRVEFLEKLTPGAIQELKQGRSRLTQFTNESGGILDDTVITNKGDHHYMVINAANIDSDMQHFAKHWADFALDQKEVQIDLLEDRALMALQGPSAAPILQGLVEAGVDLKDMAFMTSRELKVGGIECVVTRCGYTGEDGFEISVTADEAVKLARTFLKHEDVQPAGLGARDSLRLEAGLCLMGHDMTPETTPIEADLAWSIGKRRRSEGGFLGSDVILDQLNNGAARKRIGFVVPGGPPAREGYNILSAKEEQPVGHVTSGLYSPCLKKSIGMGYIRTDLAQPDTEILIDVRGRKVPAVLASMPFVPQRYYRKPKKSSTAQK